jgi:hypothetical protein
MVMAGYALIAVLVVGAGVGIWRLFASELPDVDPW